MAVHIQEDTFTLEMEGREPVILRTGQSKVEPANVRMTGYNRSATEPMRVVVVYVTDPGTTFIAPIH